MFKTGYVSLLQHQCFTYCVQRTLHSRQAVHNLPILRYFS
jgi:hypothetical protein